MFGTTQNITFPFTPTQDGFIQYCCSAPSSTATYIQIKEDGTTIYQTGDASGYAHSGMLPVRKNKVYSAVLTNVTMVRNVFVPLH